MEVVRTEVLAFRVVQYVDEQPGIALQQVGHLLVILPREIPPTGDRLPPNLIQKLWEADERQEDG